MKRFFFLLIVTVVSTLPASSQTHFITAGQTQGMIFTDYVPDYLFYTEMNIDLNHDGINDCKLIHHLYSDPMSHIGHSSDSIFTSNKCFVFSVVDSFIGNYCVTNSTWRAKNFNPSDTVYFSDDSTWQNQGVIIRNDIWLIGESCFIGFPGINLGSPSDTVPSYYFLKLITNNDTLYGFLHFSIISNHNTYDGEITMHDFACEGPTSSYIINSINDLSSSNISVSPNPFTNQINISTDKPFSYQITDYIGSVVLQGRAENNIQTGALAAGSYLLLIKNEEYYSVKKITKIHP